MHTVYIKKSELFQHQKKKNCGNHPKIQTRWFYCRVMHPKHADGMATSVDPDQSDCSSEQVRLSDLGLQCLPRSVSVWKLRNIMVPSLIYPNLSRHTIKPTIWHVCQAKTLISLGICPVWSESSLSSWRNIGPLTTYLVHSEDWSDLADAQADLSLCWDNMSFCWFTCGGSCLVDPSILANWTNPFLI